MQSIPGLKKCFNFVAELSKKLLTTAALSAISSSPPKSQKKSPSNQQQHEHSSPRKTVSPINQQNVLPGQKIQRPKVICFETFLQNRPNPLKQSVISLGLGKEYNLKKKSAPNSLRQIKKQQPKMSNNPAESPSLKKIENQFSLHNKSSFLEQNQIGPQKVYYKLYPRMKKTINEAQESADEEASEEEKKELGKKDKKNIKKNEKNSSIAQSLDINTDDMIFTYQDGDDISSIAAKSQTTDQIQPQLLSFINKKAYLHSFNKFEQAKGSNFVSVNMKKKSTHYQGETVPRKNLLVSSPKQQKQVSIEFEPKPKPKKRAFQLYPGETFEQFKKRILIQNKSSSSQNQDQESWFPGKLIKKQEYDKILSQINSSISHMDEQRNKQASILVVEKMVDESQSESQQTFKKIRQPFHDEIENYKIWDNTDHNQSFRLYFRQV